MPEPAREPVLAVDLDGTVVGINTFPHFARYLTRELLRWRKYVPLIRLLAVGVLRKAHLAGHHDLKRVVCAVSSEVPSDVTKRWAESILAQHGHGQVVDLIRRWDGPVLLTTAAPEVYALHFGELLGVREVHGSVLRDGALTDNVSHAKAVRLRATGVHDVAVFVTDDLVVDAPMAALAERVIEVQRGGLLRDCVAPSGDQIP